MYGTLKNPIQLGVPVIGKIELGFFLRFVRVIPRRPRPHALGGRRVRLDQAARGDQLAVFADAATWPARVNHPEVIQGDAAAETELTAPMHGRVTSLMCQPGDRISAGQPLLTMEAMKMEHTLRAGFDGTVEAVRCQTGSNVEAAQVLVTLEKAEG